MPIEIKELTIKVNVNTPQQSGGEGSSESPIQAQVEQKIKQDELISSTVQQVFELLRNNKER